MPTLPNGVYPSTYFTVTVYAANSDGTKGGAISTTHRVKSYSATLQLNAPDTCSLTLHLTDPQTVGIGKGNYVEVYWGYTSQQLRFSGYIQTLDRSVKRSNEFILTLAGALIGLADTMVLSNLAMTYPNYLSILDWMNGTNAPGTGAGPGQKGILTGTGWIARWVDAITTAVASTATSGNVSQGAASIGVGSTAGMTKWDAVRIGGPSGDIYSISAINGANNISIHPAAYTGYAGGATVEDLGYMLPGARPSGNQVIHSRADVSWSTALAATKKLAKDFGFHYRAAPGATRYSGVLQMGQFGEDSGVVPYGGNALLTYLQAHGFPELTEPNSAIAQKLGLAQITTPSWSDDLQHVLNCVWGIGKGNEHKYVSLQSIFGAINTGAFTQLNSTSGTRKYYLGPTFTVTNVGQTRTYQLVAVEEQGAETANGQSAPRYAFGVMNATSAQNYGVREGKLVDHATNDATKLLEQCLQAVDQFSDPVPSWVLPIKYPLTDANGVPPVVLPGQKITPNYAGKVAAVDWDTAANSPTYGQLKPTGTTYQYLAFPPTSDPTYKKATRVMKVVEEWTNHQFTQTLTLGRGHTLPQHFYEGLVADINSLHHGRGPHHTFIKRDFHHIPWLFSVDPTAYEDVTNNNITLWPGAVAVADVPQAVFFDDHHQLTFTVILSDANQWFQLWFCKPINGNLISSNAQATYGVFQIACSGSGKQSGFFTTSDGSAYTARSTIHGGGAINAARTLKTLGAYRIHLRQHGNKYEAFMSWTDLTTVSREHHVATWNDRSVALVPSSGPYGGTIGVALSGGTSTCTVAGFHAAPFYVTHPPLGAVGKGQIHPAHPSRKRHRMTSVQYSNGGAGGSYQTAKAL